MHQTSVERMSEFMNRYLNSLQDTELQIIDIGSWDDWQAYRKLAISYSQKWKYFGADLSELSNVDIILDSPYKYQFKDNTWDVVISGQVLEHIEDIFRWVEELYRITKIKGYICIIAPNTAAEHKPGNIKDCWRILPDGMNFILSKAGFTVLEAYVLGMDTVGIGKKEAK